MKNVLIFLVLVACFSCTKNGTTLTPSNAHIIHFKSYSDSTRIYTILINREESILFSKSPVFDTSFPVLSGDYIIIKAYQGQFYKATVILDTNIVANIKTNADIDFLIP